MGRLVVALAVVVILGLAWITHDPAPEVLPPTPGALCQADEDTASVLRVTEDGRVEVTPCPES